MAKSRGKLLRGYVSTLSETKLTFFFKGCIVFIFLHINITNRGASMPRPTPIEPLAHIHIKMEAKLKQQLQELAAKNSINFTQLLTRLAVDHLEAEARIYGITVNTLQPRKAGVVDE